MDTNDHTRQLERIRAKIRKAREIGWKSRSEGHRHFGVESHQMRYAEPLTEAEVSGFEARHGIVLPADYRAFVTTIASCGGGPYYGLLPLERGLDLAENVDLFLAAPSPLIPGVDYEDDWDEQLGIADEPFRGILTIVEQGCGGMCGLVVSGEASGRIVYVGDGLPYFAHDACFVDWYERWLDDLIADVPTTNFGYTRGGTQDELVASYPAAMSTSEKAEILASLSRCKELGESSVRLLIEQAADPNRIVRATATAALGACGAAGQATAARALNDPDANIRDAGITALVRMGAVAREAAALKHALNKESDAHVMFSLARVLHNASLLQPEDLNSAIASPELGIRLYAGHFLGEMGRIDGATGIERLLLDDDVHVRIYAVSACEKAGLDHSIELLGRLPDGPAAIEALHRQRAKDPAAERSMKPWWRRIFG